MLKNVELRIIQKKNEIWDANTSICSCCMLPVGELENQLLELEDFEKVVRAVYNADSPIDPIVLPPDVRRRLEIRGWKSTSISSRSDSGMAHGRSIEGGVFIGVGGGYSYANTTFFCNAAGCGDGSGGAGGVSGGGGCGGGGCGG